MLSDEEKEAVKYFKDDIKYLEDALNHPNFLGHFITIRDKEFQMLKILVNLIEKQSKEIEELKEDKYGLEEEVQMQAKNIMLCEEALYELQNKIKAKIERKFLEAKGLYERGVQPQAQYTMKLLRDLEKSLLEKE